MSSAEVADRLVAHEMEADLGRAVVGRHIIVLDQTCSTNDTILELASPSFKEGLILFAEHQTAGRGQRSNRWESAAGKGLWFSILLRPKIELSESPRLTTWAAKSISNAIRNEFSLESTIKLPNDVQVHARKIAGVLVEMRARGKSPHLAVVGIGINVNHTLEDFPPELRDRVISLAIALDRQVDRQQFAVAVLRDLNRLYAETFRVSI
jgi:BirA family transcriptional regulator, biotin operon repressor / biotin---[acetyl-CoA-carboxylase] ligase